MCVDECMYGWRLGLTEGGGGGGGLVEGMWKSIVRLSEFVCVTAYVAFPSVCVGKYFVRVLSPLVWCLAPMGR